MRTLKAKWIPAFAGMTMVWLVALLGANAVFAAEGDPQPIPPLTARVTDLTNTLTAEQKQTLESQLAALEQRKGAQVAILMLATTRPEDIAQYSIRVFDAWKLGRKNIDDGVLVIVAKDDHAVRIEPARGLEAAIPDAAAARIIREYIAPRFRANDFFGGLEDATGALTKLIDGEDLPPPLTKDNNGSGKRTSPFFDAIVWAFFVGLWARGIFGRLPGPPRAGLVGAASGGVAWLISGLLPLGIGVGIVGLVLGFLGGGGGGGFANRGGWGGFGGGGFGGGGFGGGGFGGGGGGGFSGGGGISAGGGASGSW
jgi:uncharacterized protein